jgi:hypothetical protein
MGLFGRSGNSRGAVPERSEKRRISQLNPVYFEDIQHSIAAYGGTDTVGDVAAGIANAIENICHQLFQGWDEPWGAKRFDKTFGPEVCDRSRLEVADEMIDWMVDYEATCQDALETTLGRLAEMMAKPPNASAP